jgi:hypothetical protein
MRKSLMFILAAGCYVCSLATDARVVSMGRHDAFFMDEVSIFKNPANINIFPNMVYGSYGVYKQEDDQKVDNTDFNAMSATNRDPVDPFFGGIISYSLNQGNDNGSQYPMLSIGAMFNRRDEMLDYITKGTKNYIGGANDILPVPVGKVDFLLGYVMNNGAMLGGGAYVAIQKDKEDGNETEATIVKGNLGLNWPVAKSIDLEVSVGGGTITAIANSTYDNTATLVTDDSISQTVTLASQDYFLRVESRLFTALAVLNGDFVPHLRIDVLSLDHKDIFKVDLAAGIGLNVNIDKGFFWLGLEFLYGQNDSAQISTKERVGGRISFGIERNILTDWFVIRVGGQKEIAYETDGPDKGRYVENVAADASDQDLVGLGFGINIDNRLKIDFVAAEDIAYTFSNLISKPQHHLFNRVSATYSF